MNLLLKLLPEPVLAPDSLLHLVDGDPLGLRDQEYGEDHHDEDPSGEEQEDAPLEGTKHGEESLSDNEGEEHVGEDGDALAGGPDLQREDLAGNEPAERAPGPSEACDEDAEQDHDEDCVACGETDGVLLQLQGEQYSDYHLRAEHLHAGLEKQESTAHFVHERHGHQGGHHIDGAGDDGGVEGGVALESQSAEEHRRVEHDGVDAGELLEDLS